jgi:hypothetical protein
VVIEIENWIENENVNETGKTIDNLDDSSRNRLRKEDNLDDHTQAQQDDQER